MKHLNYINQINIFFPSILMIFFAYVSFSSMAIDHNFFIISLLIIYPSLFLIQGIVCALTKGKIFLSLGVSIVTFAVIIFVWLNSSATVYIIMYLLAGFIGFGTTRLIQIKIIKH